uniref:30S ribosomal protein S17 n=1 Tax=Nephromyces sp. ex Molgula occidentalis TaxID=2544991 RepID=A0A5C1H8A5_9APIC|nr:30S ribosomal protein S17 [Nephromyces sp. ex Molgula occidentalis]
MNKQYIGFVISKLNINTIKILYSYIYLNKKYNIKQTKYKAYLIQDFRNEALKGDRIIFKKIKPKSKNKYFKLVKVIKNYGTSRNNI